VILEKATAGPGDAPQRNPDGSLLLVDGATVDALADPRWIGSGRVVVDNKGNPVKQYEPYFSSTLAYEAETEVRERGVTSLMHYDPLGRLVRTDFQNGTHARTELTPWLQRTFDANDSVLDSDWHAARVALPAGDPERRAAEITEAYASTPVIVHFDALGRTFLTVEDPGTTPLETRLVLDVVGNVLEVVDARGNTAEARVFGMLQQVLESTSVDAGMRRALTDVGGGLLRSWNSRGFVSRVAYDMLRRPTHAFVTPSGSGEMLVTRTIWGEDVASSEADNLRTRVFRIYDGAGVLTSEAFDFKGNLLRQSRRLAVGHETTRDWLVLEGAVPQTPAAIASIAELELDAETFAFAMQYDALNRVTSRTTPDDSETLMTYNEAGLLEAVDVRIRGAASATTFVGDFDYNARGQRLQCVHGNGTTATYEYDPNTFRLARLRLVRDSAPAVSLQDLRYTPTTPSATSRRSATAPSRRPSSATPSSNPNSCSSTTRCTGSSWPLAGSTCRSRSRRISTSRSALSPTTRSRSATTRSTTSGTRSATSSSCSMSRPAATSRASTSTRTTATDCCRAPRRVSRRRHSRTRTPTTPMAT